MRRPPHRQRPGGGGARQHPTGGGSPEIETPDRGQTWCILAALVAAGSAHPEACPFLHPHSVEVHLLIHTLVVLLAAFALTQITVLVTSIYLHRTLAHRAIALHPVADVVFRAFLWLTTGIRRQEWVAVHRKHHTFCDREGDPHSPRLLGVWRVQLFNVVYYMREARRPETVRTFAPDIAEDWWDRAVFSWVWTGLALGTGALCLALGFWSGIIVMLLHGALYVLVLSPTINGLGHWRGAQTYDNTAYNSRTLAWVTGGESLHNNHHAHPKSARFSGGRLEFDPSWPVIRAIETLGLATMSPASSRLPRP